MVRAARLFIVMVGLLFVPALAGAQTPLNCKIAAAARDLKAGAEPDFVGCLYPEAKKLLEASDYQAGFVPAKPRPGVQDWTIVQQRRIEGRFIFSVVNPTKEPVDPATPEPPAPKRVIFSIGNAQPVTEGGRLTFPIMRDGNDGKSHSLMLRYSDRTLLAEPQDSIEILPLDSAPVLTLTTRATPPGDGDHRLQVLIVPGDDGASIGVPRAAIGLISDSLPPPPPPPSQPSLYTVTVIGQPGRGQDVRFLITRTGSLPAATVPFSVVDDGQTLFRLDAEQVVFADGEPHHEATVSGGRYGFCSSSVGLTLEGVSGPRTSATRFFTDALPDDCKPKPWWTDFVPPGRLWGIPPGVIVIGGIPLVWWLRKRPVPDPVEDDAPAVDPETDTDGRAPPPVIHVSSTVERGNASFDPSDDVMGRWPAFATKVVIERGESDMPAPLPIRETSDG